MTQAARLAIVGVVLAASGCTTRGPRSSAVAAVAPQLSVERFLQAANVRDFEAMGRLFGTADGPIRDTGSTFGCMFKKIGSWFGGSSCRQWTDVEIQLDAIASVLQHQDYRIVREDRVAGRTNPTTRVTVDLTVANRRVEGVPFLVVQTNRGQWLVEFVDLQRVMQRRP